MISMISMITTVDRQLLLTLLGAGLLACGDDSAVQPTVPTTIEAVSGDHQVGNPSAQLASPLVVRVTDDQDRPAAGVSVTWAVVDGGGSITSPSSTTGSDGTASAQFILGPTIGDQRAQATAEGLAGSPIGFTETAAQGSGGPLVLSVAGGGNNLADRYSSDLWVYGNHAYTGTWNFREAQGNVLNVWTLDAAGAPSFTSSVTIPNIGTVSDVQVSEDGQLLVLSGESGGDYGQDGGVYVYRLTDPAHPDFVGSVSVPYGGVHTVTLANLDGQLHAFAAKNPGRRRRPPTGTRN